MEDYSFCIGVYTKIYSYPVQFKPKGFIEAESKIEVTNSFWEEKWTVMFNSYRFSVADEKALEMDSGHFVQYEYVMSQKCTAKNS